MERKRIFRSGVVLLELMAAILIFALAGAICIQVLVKAEETAAQAQRLTDGVNYASSAAEVFRAADSGEEALEMLTALWPQSQTGERTVIPFERGQLEITQNDNAGLRIYDIQWVCGGERVYRLEIIRQDFGKSAELGEKE